MGKNKLQVFLMVALVLTITCCLSGKPETDTTTSSSDIATSPKGTFAGAIAQASGSIQLTNSTLLSTLPNILSNQNTYSSRGDTDSCSMGNNPECYTTRDMNTINVESDHASNMENAYTANEKMQDEIKLKYDCGYNEMYDLSGEFERCPNNDYGNLSFMISQAKINLFFPTIERLLSFFESRLKKIKGIPLVERGNFVRTELEMMVTFLIDACRDVLLNFGSLTTDAHSSALHVARSCSINPTPRFLRSIFSSTKEIDDWKYFIRNEKDFLIKYESAKTRYESSIGAFNTLRKESYPYTILPIDSGLSKTPGRIEIEERNLAEEVNKILQIETISLT